MEPHVAERPAALQIADRLIGALSGLAVVVACLWITVVMLWIVGDVIGRSLAISGITGTVAVAADSVVAISFLCIPYAMRNGGHIRSTILVNRFPVRTSMVLLAAAQLLGGLIFAFVAYASWDPMLSSWATGEYTGEGALRIPTAPFRTVVVGGSLLMALECALAVERTVRTAFATRRGGDDE